MTHLWKSFSHIRIQIPVNMKNSRAWSKIFYWAKKSLVWLASSFSCRREVSAGKHNKEMHVLMLFKIGTVSAPSCRIEVSAGKHKRKKCSIVFKIGTVSSPSCRWGLCRSQRRLDGNGPGSQLSGPSPQLRACAEDNIKEPIKLS